MADKARRQEALDLRRHAEEALAARQPALGPAMDGTRLLHELQVHQIELEMQNEQLRQVQTDLEASLTRFTDLYEFAPVGYLTLTAAGFVDESNHTAATLLGVEWAKLLRRRFDPLVVQADISRWYRFFAELLQEPDGQRQSIRLGLCNAAGATIPVQLNCVCVKRQPWEAMVRIAIIELGAHD